MNFPPLQVGTRKGYAGRCIWPEGKIANRVYGALKNKKAATTWGCHGQKRETKMEEQNNPPKVESQIIQLILEPLFYRNKFRIQIGMSRQEALEIFDEWRIGKKTCLRCEGEKYFDLCPMRWICKEADDVGNAARNDNRRRTAKTIERESVRARSSEKRERAAIREVFKNSTDLPGRGFDGMVQEPSGNV